MALFVMYFLIAMVVPFVFAIIMFNETTKTGTDEVSTGSKMPVIPVFGAYGAFLALSTFTEGLIPAMLRKTLGKESGATHCFCNRYLLTKWRQGQLANLDTFVHVCFIASVTA